MDASDLELKGRQPPHFSNRMKQNRAELAGAGTTANAAAESTPIDDERQSRELASDQDPLLDALLLVAEHHGRPVSTSAVVSGLPLVRGRLTSELFPRAADRAGLVAEPVSRPLHEIPNLVMPVVLVLVGGIAVLTSVNVTGGKATITDLSSGRGTTETVTLALLERRYSGFAFYVKPKPLAAGRRDVLNSVRKAHWFWSVVSRFRTNYVHIALSALLINIVALVFPLFTMAVYDRVLPNFAISSLVALAIGVLLSLVFDVVIRTARSKMIDMTGKQADVVLAANLFEHVMGLTMRTRPQSVGVLANQLRDFDSVREFFTSASLISITDIAFAVIFIAVMFLIAGPIGFVPLLLIPAVVGIGLVIQRPLDRAMKELQAEAAARHGVLIESLAGIETVKSLGAEGRMQSVWERSVAASARASEAVHHWSSLAITLSNSVQQCAQLAILVWGVFLVLDNTITVGALVAANLLAGRVLQPLANIAAMMTRASQTSLSLQAIDRVMSLEVERPKDKVFVARTIDRGEITFKDVSFAYGGKKSRALDNVSFSICAGERVGIVGRIGSGKTTIGRLISRLYEPDDGQILIDGIDIRQYDPADLRAGIGFVLQDVQLFFGTLRDNIAIGRPAARDSEIIEAGRLAGVESFVAKHPDGYDLPIAEGGLSLSGGQRQAVALARVLLRKPKVLFMDEPTSALDLASESEFCQRLNNVLGRDTTFIVSTHRVSLLRFVDRLIVIDNGKLVADGPRDQVLTELQRINREAGANGEARHASV